jgi:hypothetical protein
MPWLAPATIPTPDSPTMPLELPRQSPWSVFTANPADDAAPWACSCDDPSATGGSVDNVLGNGLGSTLACLYGESCRQCSTFARSCDDPRAAGGFADNRFGKWLGNHLGLSLRRILPTTQQPMTLKILKAPGDHCSHMHNRKPKTGLSNREFYKKEVYWP